MGRGGKKLIVAASVLSHITLVADWNQGPTLKLRPNGVVALSDEVPAIPLEIGVVAPHQQDTPLVREVRKLDLVAPRRVAVADDMVDAVGAFPKEVGALAGEEFLATGVKCDLEPHFLLVVGGALLVTDQTSSDWWAVLAARWGRESRIVADLRAGDLKLVTDLAALPVSRVRLNRASVCGRDDGCHDGNKRCQYWDDEFMHDRKTSCCSPRRRN